MIKKYKKGIKIFFIIYIIITAILYLKIVVNKNFIKNYPDKEQGSRLLFLSMLNFYEPYIAPYNYGNYYYKQERYEDAYKKYKEALNYKIPEERQCAVDTNMALTIINIAKQKSKDEAQELYEEAKGYLNDCISIDFPKEQDNPTMMQSEEIIKEISDIEAKMDKNVGGDNGIDGSSGYDGDSGSSIFGGSGGIGINENTRDYSNGIDIDSPDVSDKDYEIEDDPDLEQKFHPSNQDNNTPFSIDRGSNFTTKPIRWKPRPCDECW